MPLHLRLARLALVLCLAASTQGLLFVQGAFSANQDWIAETLCVNRDRPDMECEGACELSKRMAEHQERDDDRRAADLGAALTVAACEAESLTVPADRTADATPSLDEPLALAAQHDASGVFRPPQRG